MGRLLLGHFLPLNCVLYYGCLAGPATLPVHPEEQQTWEVSTQGAPLCFGHHLMTGRWHFMSESCHSVKQHNLYVFIQLSDWMTFLYLLYINGYLYIYKHKNLSSLYLFVCSDWELLFVMCFWAHC